MSDGSWEQNRPSASGTHGSGRSHTIQNSALKRALGAQRQRPSRQRAHFRLAGRALRFPYNVGLRVAPTVDCLTAIASLHRFQPRTHISLLNRGRQPESGSAKGWVVARGRNLGFENKLDLIMSRRLPPRADIHATNVNVVQNPRVATEGMDIDFRRCFASLRATGATPASREREASA